jgi:hypothetical protein
MASAASRRERLIKGRPSMLNSFWALGQCLPRERRACELPPSLGVVHGRRTRFLDNGLIYGASLRDDRNLVPDR